jgi:hypothetical protein
LAREKRQLIEIDIRNLHWMVMQRSRPDIAGRYADLARYVRTETGRHEFPSPSTIPALMGALLNGSLRPQIQRKPHSEHTCAW